MKIVDLQLNIDGVILDDNDSVDDLIEQIKTVINSHYDITYTILYVGELEDLE